MPDSSEFVALAKDEKSKSTLNAGIINQNSI